MLIKKSQLFILNQNAVKFSAAVALCRAMGDYTGSRLTYISPLAAFGSWKITLKSEYETELLLTVVNKKVYEVFFFLCCWIAVCTFMENFTGPKGICVARWAFWNIYF